MQDIAHAPNLVALFLDRAAERGDAPFLRAKIDGAWRPTGWGEAARQVAALAEALRALGLAPGDRVLLVSENRPEWAIADLAIMAAGLVTVPAYATNTGADHDHVLADSGARAAIVSTAKLARTLLPAVARSADCRDVVAIEAAADAPDGVRLHDWTALIAAQPGDVAACRAAATFRRGDLACLIYTSGTGGLPRGVRQHHGAILHNVAGTAALLTEDFGRGDEVFLSLLPLSHAYEHSAGLYLPIGLGAEIWYSEGLDKLAANIAEVRPTIMIVVPRLFEVLRARILKGAEKQGRPARWLMRQASALAARGPRARDVPLRALLSLTLHGATRARFGGRLKAMVAGGAPLNPEIGEFFRAVGLTVLQGYGQTEAGPVISCNRPRAGIAMGTVGPPLDRTEVVIADDGEIRVRGENVMHGYWRNEAETARALVDGWLLTGDIGRLDARGRLVITDRKKDLIVNDKGENVAPQRVEGMLTLAPEIGQAMVSGDRRPYLVGVVVPDASWAAEWIREHRTGREDPAFARAVSAAVDRVNGSLALTEKVRRVLIADEPFTIENGELTPSLKIRRHRIRARYGERLDALYAR